jgi:LysR family transcriptional regulator, nitrogen assimilation regulatory protein
VDIRQLRSCIAIAEAGSFSEAARRMHIAQPALSERIAELEQALGVTLFDRNRRGATLTETGKQFVEQARGILLDVSTLQASMLAASHANHPKIRIGISPTLAGLLISKIFEVCRKISPLVEISLVEGMTADLTLSLAKGEIDFAVGHGFVESAAIMVYPMATEPLCAIYKLENSPAPQSISFEQVIRAPLLLPQRGQAMRALVEQHAAKAGHQLRYAGDVDTLTGIIAAAEVGAGVAILPNVALYGLRTSDQLAVVVISNPTIERTVSIAASVMSTNSSLARLSALALQPMAKQLIEQGSWQQARAIGTSNDG